MAIRQFDIFTYWLGRNFGPGMIWVLPVLMLLTIPSFACYNKDTGDTHIGDAIHFKLPAFPETGGNAVQIFTEMHYQPSYRTQEGPRLLPPKDSVPITGKELLYSTLNEYKQLTIPESTLESYNHAKAQELYNINCLMCHGKDLHGFGPVRTFMTRGPFPADLTSDIASNVSDGELFGFISGGGNQGLAARLRNKRSVSPMPEFKMLLTEEERWTLVQFLRQKQSDLGK